METKFDNHYVRFCQTEIAEARQGLEGILPPSYRKLKEYNCWCQGKLPDEEGLETIQRISMDALNMRDEFDIEAAKEDIVSYAEFTGLYWTYYMLAKEAGSKMEGKLMDCILKLSTVYIKYLQNLGLDETCKSQGVESQMIRQPVEKERSEEEEIVLNEGVVKKECETAAVSDSDVLALIPVNPHHPPVNTQPILWRDMGILVDATITPQVLVPKGSSAKSYFSEMIKVSRDYSVNKPKINGFIRNILKHNQFYHPFIEITEVVDVEGTVKKYCVKATENIPRGLSLGFFAGKVVKTSSLVQAKKEEAEEVSDFLFKLPTAFNMYSLDAKRFGNWTRFIRRSDCPNLYFFYYFYKNIPYIIFETLCDIQKGDELKYEYDSACGIEQKEFKQQPIEEKTAESEALTQDGTRKRPPVQKSLKQTSSLSKRRKKNVVKVEEPPKANVKESKPEQHITNGEEVDQEDDPLLLL